VGVTYEVAADNSITVKCGASTDLTACWVLGTPHATLTLPNLGSTPVASIRGLRFTYTKLDQSNWERPSNPTQSVTFTVERRDTLIEKNPDAATAAVPSTLFGNLPAPGETTPGVYTNAVSVTASGGDTSDPTPVWVATDTDFKQLKYQHLPARVEIKKSPVGQQALGVDIPYQIDVINRGGAHEKLLGSVVVTDTFPVDAQGPQLVIPTDPDTGLPFPVSTAFTYALLNGSGVAQAAPTVTAVLGAATIPSQSVDRLHLRTAQRQRRRPGGSDRDGRARRGHDPEPDDHVHARVAGNPAQGLDSAHQRHPAAAAAVRDRHARRQHGDRDLRPDLRHL